MDSANAVEINGFHISPEEVRKNGAGAVASNRLHIHGHPTRQQIESFAKDIKAKFSETNGPVVASVPRFPHS